MMYIVINMALALAVDNSGMCDHRRNLDSNIWGGGTIICFWHDSPPVGQGILVHEVSRSHTTHQSVGLLRMSDQLVTETSTSRHS
jgi:hypothetical protein